MKLMNLDQTAYESVRGLQKKLEERKIEHPVIDVEKDYNKNIPALNIRAQDHVNQNIL